MAVKTSDKKITVTNTQNDYEFSASKKDAIYLKGITQADIDTTSFSITDNKLLFSTLDGKNFSVSNYSGVKYIKTDINSKKTALLDIISNSLVDNTANIITSYNAKKLTTSSTNYNDAIDMSGVSGLKKTVKVGKKTVTEDKLPSDKGLIINGGYGNDIITGSMYSDTIKGGAGNNTVIVKNGTFGNDTINLTKGENLTLDLTDYGFTSSDDLKGIAKISGNNLILKTANGKVTVKDYVKGTANVSIKLSDDITINPSIDDIYSYTNSDFTKNTSKKTATFTGSKYKETIEVTNALDGYTKTIDGGKGINTINVNSNGKVTVTGGSGVDNITVSNNNKATVIKAGNGANVINVQNGTGTSSITTGSSNDTITVTNSGSATINSGSGNDFIIGGFGNDTVKGEAGTDTITGGRGNDKLSGGAGADTFIFNKGDGGDTITDADKYDRIQITDVDKEDLRFGKNGNNLEIYYDNSFDEKNKITVKNYFKQKANKRVTELITQNGTINLPDIDYSITGKGTINGTKYDDNIIGSSSADTIKADSGTDTVIARAGNDKLYGGTTANSRTTFIFNKGDGKDTVYSGKGQNTLQFNDVDLSKITFTQGTKSNNTDLIIKYSDTDQVTVKDYYKVDKKGKITGINTKNSVKYFVVNGEQKATLSFVDKKIIIFSGNFNLPQNSEFTSVQISEQHVDDLSYSHDLNSNDLVILYNNNNKVTLQNYFGNTSHPIVTLNGESINQLITGNINEIYDFSNGLNISEIVSNGGTDSLKFEGNIRFSHNTVNNDLVISYGDNKSVTLKDYYTNDNHSVKTIENGDESFTIEQALNKYGIDITGTEEDETLIGTDSDDTIFGNGGFDTINGGKGNNTILFNTNVGGFYTIENGGGIDTIQFNNDTNLSFVHNVNSPIVLYYNDGIAPVVLNNTAQTRIKDSNGILTITEALNKYGVSISGTTGDDVITGTDGDDVIIAREGNDTISGGKGNNTYAFFVGDGTNTIENGQGIDKIDLVHNAPLAANFSRDINNNNLKINYGEDSNIILKDYFLNTSHSVKTIILNEVEQSLDDLIAGNGIYITGTSGNDNITGSDGDDYIYGYGGNDTIEGGKGNDILAGNSGENTYIFNTGDGNDIIESNLSVYDINNGNGNDTIQVNTPELRFSRNLNNNNLVMSYSSNDSVTFNGYYKYNSSDEENELNYVKTIKNGDETLTVTQALNKYGIDITGTANSDTITGTSADDKINTGKGNDTINGGSGNNTYIFNYGDEADTIENSTGIDTIQFNTQSSLRFSHDIANNDLVMSYGDGDSITLQDYYVNNPHSVQTIQNGNETLTIYETLNQYGIDITGTIGNDIITGTDANDTIVADGGNDTIDGGKGNDTISGGSDNNTIIFNTGDGQDTIVNGSGTDIIQLNTKSTLRFSHNFNDDDLVVSYGNGDSITIQDYYVNDSHSVQTIKNGNETLTIPEALNLYGIDVSITTNGKTISGTNANDIFTIGNVDCTINKGLGTDRIVCSSNANIKYQKLDSSNDLYIYHGTNKITLKDYFEDYSHSVQTIKNGTNIINISDDITKKGIEVLLSLNSPSGTNYNDTIVNNIDIVSLTDGLGNNNITNNGTVSKNIQGGIGDDIITNSGAVQNNIYCGNGNDTVINSGTINGYIYGEDGNDIITIKNGGQINTHVVGGNGTDTIIVESGALLKRDIYGGLYAENADIDGDDIITIAGTVEGYIFGENGNDTITIKNGGQIDTHVIGGNGADTIIVESGALLKRDIYGGLYAENTDIDGNDTITIAGTVEGRIFGEDGDDTITIESGAVVKGLISGGNGNDTYVFNIGAGNNTIDCQTGNDTIWIKNGAVRYNATINGRDLIIKYGNDDTVTLTGYLSGTSSVQNIKIGNAILTLEDAMANTGIDINGTDGDDTINGTTLSDNIDGGKGSDTIYGGAGNDNIYGGKNDYGTIYEVPGNDTIYGEDGDDYIETSKGYEYINQLGKTQTMYSNNYIDGGAGNDIIVCHNGNNTIIGGLGDDNITAGLGINNITSGKGDDIINLIHGEDTNKYYYETYNTLVFSKGDGNDIITGGFGGDNLEFKDNTKDELLYEKNNNDLIIKHGEDHSDVVTLEDYFVKYDNDRYITTKDTKFQFRYNSYISLKAGDEGTYMNDVYTITNNDFNTVIESSEGTDTIYFKDSNYEDLEYNVLGNDLFISFNKINGENRNFVQIKDIMRDENNSVKYIKTLNKNSINIKNTTTVYDDLLIEGDTMYGTIMNDVVTIPSNAYPYTIYLGDGDDIITNHSDATINGEKGNDTFILDSVYSPKLVFESGDGNDIIYNMGENDTLCFKNDSIDINFIDNFVYTKQNEDLIINYTKDDSITIKDYFLSGYNIKLKNLNSNWNTTYNLHDKFICNPNKKTLANKYVDYYINSNKKLFYTYKEVELGSPAPVGTKSNEITSISLTLGDKTLYKSDDIRGSISGNMLNGGYSYHFYFNIDNMLSKNNDIYYNDCYINNYISSNTGIPGYQSRSYSETVNASFKYRKIKGGDSNNIIVADGNASIIEPGKGDDYLYLGNKNVSVNFSNGDGNDTIYTYNSNVFISFENDNNFTFEKQGEHLIIGYNLLNGIAQDTIKIINHFISNNPIELIDAPNLLVSSLDKIIDKISINGDKNNINNLNGTKYNDIIYGGNLNDIIFGADGNDTINGGKGNDTISGGEGNDTFVFNSGDGQDIIINDFGEDNIQLTTNKNIEYIRNMSNNDLVINYGNEDSINLKDYYLNNSHSVKNITVNNNTYDILSSHSMKILGTNQNDTIISGYTNDTIVAGTGDDILKDEYGKNTFVFNVGDGNDIIVNGKGNDIIEFTTPQNLRFSHNLDNNDLVISYGNEDTITLQDYYANNSHSVKTIKNKNESISISNALNTYGIDIVNIDNCASIIGTNGNDTIINNGNIINTIGIQGSNGDDTIKNYGTAITVSGDIGNDIITNSGEVTSIFGGDGNDIITNNGNAQSINGNKGNDTIVNEINGIVGEINGDNSDIDENPPIQGFDTITNKGTVTGRIYGCDGDDTIINDGIVGDGIYGGKGSDLYKISKLINYCDIHDKSGDNDIISVTGVNKTDLTLRFDLQIDNEGIILDNLSKNMYITTVSDFGNTEKGIKVTNQFVEDNSIETITTADGYSLTTNEINQLRENIAGWLHTNGFENVQQIIDSGNETNINNLIAQFQNADWQQIA